MTTRGLFRLALPSSTAAGVYRVREEKEARGLSTGVALVGRRGRKRSVTIEPLAVEPSK